MASDHNVKRNERGSSANCGYPTGACHYHELSRCLSCDVHARFLQELSHGSESATEKFCVAARPCARSRVFHGEHIVITEVYRQSNDCGEKGLRPNTPTLSRARRRVGEPLPDHFLFLSTNYTCKAAILIPEAQIMFIQSAGDPNDPVQRVRSEMYGCRIAESHSNV